MKEICIWSCNEIGDTAIIPVGKNCKLLRSLTLEFCKSVSDAGLAGIAEFVFFKSYTFTDKGLAAIARGCPDLVCLNISHLQGVGDMALAEIGKRCSQLRELFLFECSGITDLGLFHLAKGCSQLERCRMESCKRVTATRVATIVSSCPKLKKFHVEECKVTERTWWRATSVFTYLPEDWHQVNLRRF